MPITLTDDAGNEIDLDKADGGTLRRKLEEALAENKTLSGTLATFVAQKAVEEHGAGLIKPEDLAGVPADQVETKAKELVAQRQAQRTEVIRSVMAERGLEGSELDSAVEEFLAGNPAPAPSAEEDRESAWTDLESLGGTRPARKPTAPGIEDAMGNLTSYFEGQEKRKK